MEGIVFINVNRLTASLRAARAQWRAYGAEFPNGVEESKEKSSFAKSVSSFGRRVEKLQSAGQPDG